MYWT
jgi:hypothetical protein